VSAARGGRPGRGLWDPGAQPERTYQAWMRTTLSVVVCALLLARLARTAGIAALVLGGCAIVAAAVLAAGQRRRLVRGRIGSAPHAVAALTALVVGVAAAALVLITAGALG
jgi:uncharacterized membrane protein YidH (DUF202 family)